MDHSPVTTQPFADLADVLLPGQAGTDGERALQERFGTARRASETETWTTDPNRAKTGDYFRAAPAAPPEP